MVLGSSDISSRSHEESSPQSEEQWPSPPLGLLHIVRVEEETGLGKAAKSTLGSCEGISVSPHTSCLQCLPLGRVPGVYEGG